MRIDSDSSPLKFDVDRIYTQQARINIHKCLRSLYWNPDALMPYYQRIVLTYKLKMGQQHSGLSVLGPYMEITKR